MNTRYLQKVNEKTGPCLALHLKNMLLKKLEWKQGIMFFVCLKIQIACVRWHDR